MTSQMQKVSRARTPVLTMPDKSGYSEFQPMHTEQVRSPVQSANMPFKQNSTISSSIHHNRANSDITKEPKVADKVKSSAASATLSGILGNSGGSILAKGCFSSMSSNYYGKTMNKSVNSPATVRPKANLSTKLGEESQETPQKKTVKGDGGYPPESSSKRL